MAPVATYHPTSTRWRTGVTAWLIERSGPTTGARHEIRGTVKIGRDPSNEVALSQAEASRQHAAVRELDGRYVVEDLGSKNGTRLNGTPVVGTAELRPGDEILIPGLVLLFATDETLTSIAARPVEASPDEASILFNAATGEILVRGVAAKVTAKEHRALELLLGKRGGLVAKDEFARGVWPEYEGGVSDYNIEQLISRLRRKIELDPAAPEHILTHRGLGYRLLGVSSTKR